MESPETLELSPLVAVLQPAEAVAEVPLFRRRVSPALSFRQARPRLAPIYDDLS